MQLIIKSKTADGNIGEVVSQCGRYTWFWGQDRFIVDHTAGRSIYKMRHMRHGEFGSDPLPEDVAADARAFWAALRELQATTEKLQKSAKLAEIGSYRAVKRQGIAGVNYPCDQCGSYCAGDCEASK